MSTGKQYPTNLSVVREQCAFLGDDKVNSICDLINKASKETVEDMVRNTQLIKDLGWPVDEAKILKLMNIGFYDRLEQAKLSHFAKVFNIQIQVGTLEEQLAAAELSRWRPEEMTEEEHSAEEQLARKD